MSDEKVQLRAGETTVDVRQAAEESARAMDNAEPIRVVSRENVDLNPPTNATAPPAKKEGRKKRGEVATAAEVVQAEDRAVGETAGNDTHGPSVVQDATTTEDDGSDASPAADASDATTGGRKGGKRKSSAVPSKNVNPRRVIEPKTTPETPNASPVVNATATPDAPKRGRGRPPGTPGKKKAEPTGPKRGRGRPPKAETVPAIPLPTGPLSESESARFNELQSVISEGMRSFLNVGNALLEIKASALYREKYPDYETYLRVVWDISPRQERNLTGGATAHKVLEAAGASQLPKTESQTRFLIGVADEKKPAVWNLAIEKATAEGKSEPERRHVEEAANEIGRVRANAGTPRVTATSSGTGSPAGGGFPVVPGRTLDELAKAQASGVLPENVTIDVTPVDDSSDEFADIISAPPEDITMDDDKWLAQFPILKRLAEPCQVIFKADALAYRWLSGPRVTFIRTAIRPVVKEAKAGSGGILGAYINRIRYAMKTPHPAKWIICPSCNGTGQRASGSGECGDCRKQGYRLP